MKRAARRPTGETPKQRDAENPVLLGLADMGVDKNLTKEARSAARMLEDRFRLAATKAVRIAVASVEGTTAVIRAASLARESRKLARKG